MSNSITINLTAGLDGDFSGLLEDANGDAISITAGSNVLFYVYRGNPETPDLSINSLTPLAGGSVTSFIAGSGDTQGTWYLKVCGADTEDLVPGAYDIKLVLVDAGDSNRHKWVSDGVLFMEGKLGT